MNGTRRVRVVAVVTGSRAEYGLLTPVVKALRDTGLTVQLVVTGMHLLKEFGDTVATIEQDGVGIDRRVDMSAEGDGPSAMVQALGKGVQGLGRAFEELEPDVVLVLGDRVEAFAAAIAGAGSNRIVAHVHGGDVTRGGLDESMRHAITKLAHLHFAATDRSRERIVRMGEPPERVFTVGAPGLDTIRALEPQPLPEIARAIGAPLERPFVVLVQHPVTTAADAAASEMSESLEAMRMSSARTICIYPNSDAGGRRMIEVIESYRQAPWLTIVRSLPHSVYLNLLRHAAALVGNSSSGIIESAALGLPAVNVGPRQDGRERANNVIDVRSDRNEIAEALRRAITQEFRTSAGAAGNPYGDGRAGERIASTLASTSIDPGLLQKQLTYR